MSFLPAAQTLATVAKASHALAILVVAAVYTYPKRLCDIHVCRIWVSRLFLEGTSCKDASFVSPSYDSA